MHPGPTPDYEPEFQFLLETVADNLELHTKRKQKDTKPARIAFHGTGRNPIPKLKAFVKGGHIKNCPVLSEDMDRAADIFSPDCSHLKGTSTRPHPPRVRSPDVMEIPRALRTKMSPLALHLDVMCVNGMPMLTTVDSRIKHRALVPLKNRTAESLCDSLDNVLCRHNRATIYVTSIDSDIEFKTLFEDVEDNMDAKFSCAPQGEHVPAAKRNNRTIADRICVAVHYLPCRNIPRLLLKHAVSETEKLNWFPAEGGLSDTFTPHQFLELPPIDWNKDATILQGSHCQAFTERTIKNDLKQRVLDALFLTPMKNKQGCYVMLNLATNKEITSTCITQAPVTDSVVQTVKELAAQDSMTPLKIEHHTHTVIHNNHMLSGIDCEEATTDDSSVKTFGTIFGRGLEPVAAEEAAALPVDSVSPVGLPGAAAPEGGSPSD